MSQVICRLFIKLTRPLRCYPRGLVAENGFIDSTADATKLKNSDFRQALAIAHAKGICDYFGIRYEEGEEKDMLDVAVVSILRRTTQWL